MRLIDADEMFKLPNHQEFPTGYTDGYNDAISNMESQPTAYDLDAVISELEKGLQNAKMHKEKHSYSDEFINGYIKGREDTLDVVKRGVKNDK